MVLSIIGYSSNRNKVQGIISVLWGIVLVSYITHGNLILKI
jgi:hypothetical protein